MDRLFIHNRDDFRTTLGIVCRHLTFIEDLLALEQVSDLCRSAVRAHHHHGRVTLSLPNFKNRSTVTDQNGPIVTNLALELSTIKSSSREDQPALDINLRQSVAWMVNTLNKRASHLKRLQIELHAWLDPGLGEDQLTQQQTRNLPTDQRMVLFPKCTQLKLDFRRVVARQPNEKLILSSLLRHFPALEHLELVGDHFPLLSKLPAPEKLKILKVYLIENRHERKSKSYWDVSQVAPKVLNFQRLEVMHLKLPRKFDVPEVEDASNPYSTAATGVCFLESLSASRALREIRLESLTPWSVALLSSDRIKASPSGSEGLKIKIDLEYSHDLILDLEGRLLAGSLLRRVTHLTIRHLHSEWAISELLKLTPAIQELIIKSAAKSDREPFGEVDWPLHSLARLTVPESRMSVSWLESVRRNASPTLQVQVTFIRTPSIWSLSSSS